MYGVVSYFVCFYILQSPRYDTQRTVLADLLKHYLSIAVKCDSGREEDGVLKEKQCWRSAYNVAASYTRRTTSGMECGYSDDCGLRYVSE